jgi:hypothetical protein
MRIAVVLLAACALAGALRADQAAAEPGVKFGIQDDAWLEHGPGTLASRVATLDRMGLDVVRVTLNWHRIEPRPGAFRWDRSDRLLRALRARGLAPVVTIVGTPGWANGGDGPNIAPLDPGDFQVFTRTVALRYPFVRHWVIWNEPNKPLWLTPASPTTYVRQILNPGYRGIKEVNRAALVAGGVTAPRGGSGGTSPVDFIRGMDRAGARLDAYAHHPYPVYPGDTPYSGGCSCKTITMASLERLIRLVDEAFPRARVWLTEYGYQTNPPDAFGVSRLEQARFVAEAARRVYVARKVDMLIHYLYRDEPEVGRWQSGLETVDGRAKPSLAATMLPLAQVSRRSERVTLWGQVRPGDGRQRYVLQQRVGSRWVAVGGTRVTDGAGYLVRTVPARKGSRLRVWYPTRRLASPTLTVR